ncbi:MAG: response regulator [Proteobacteria bacterium]|nr:response regulator [Pseudomonadota bacterium]
MSAALDLQPHPEPDGAAPALAEAPLVLVVDDSPSNLAVIVDLLEPHYRVRAATNGVRALALARIDPRPDLILLDIVMPFLSGYDVLAQLQADPATRQIPVMFMTALGDAEHETHGFDLGAADYIAKPFGTSAVLARIRAVLERHRDREHMQSTNALLAAEVARQFADLEHAQDVTILALARLAQARDPETGHHLRRTQEYVRLLATQLRAMGLHVDELSPRAITLMAKCAPLHDIGKVAIPDHILLKPGPLSAAEWDVMRRHPTAGREAIERAEDEIGVRLDFLRYAKEICQSHHERWDGSGYPHGLTGGAIPLSARLMALGDVFDALISQRPYKDAMPAEEARAIIVAQRGRHFDPAVVDAFEAVFEAFVAVAERLREPSDNCPHQSRLFR